MAIAERVGFTPLTRPGEVRAKGANRRSGGPISWRLDADVPMSAKIGRHSTPIKPIHVA